MRRDVARWLRALADRLDPQTARAWWISENTVATSSIPNYTITTGTGGQGGT